MKVWSIVILVSIWITISIFSARGSMEVKLNQPVEYLYQASLDAFNELNIIVRRKYFAEHVAFIEGKF